MYCYSIYSRICYFVLYNKCTVALFVGGIGYPIIIIVLLA